MDRLEAWLESKRTSGMTMCWMCLKPLEDMGAERQWCSQKCLDAWKERDGAIK